MDDEHQASMCTLSEISSSLNAIEVTAFHFEQMFEWTSFFVLFDSIKKLSQYVILLLFISASFNYRYCS